MIQYCIKVYFTRGECKAGCREEEDEEEGEEDREEVEIGD